jgi:hypothetical protein
VKFWTWAEIKARLTKELDIDLDYDGLVDDEELLNYTNDAIDEAESHILSLHEDYFLSKDDLTLVNGTDEYDPPSNIYASKIRDLVYHKDTDVYRIPRVKNWHKFLAYREGRVTSSNNLPYAYFIVNNTAGSPKILFTPPAYEDGQLVEVWYIRNANRLTGDADVCDIPEFIQFILWHVKSAVLGKDGHPAFAAASQKLDFWRAQMIQTLENMVIDNQNEIEPDYSHYEESDL